MRGQTFISNAGQFDEAGRQFGTGPASSCLKNTYASSQSWDRSFLIHSRKILVGVFLFAADARSPSLRCEPGPASANRPPRRCTAPTRAREGIRTLRRSNQLSCRNSNAAFAPAANVRQEGVEPRNVFLEVRRQLEQNRPLAFFQHGRDANEVVGVGFGILQPPEMRDELPSFEHESK